MSEETERSGAQQLLEGEGFEPELSDEIQRLLEDDRDAHADHSKAKTAKDAAREALIEQMKEEGLDEVRCPFRGKMIELDWVPKVKIRAVKEVDQGEGE